MKRAIAQQDSLTATSSGAKRKATATPCCRKVGIKRGPWTPEEDEILAKYVKKEGEGQWRTLPEKAGLLRCGKSCRLRWMNYLRPCVKRGRIAPDEEDLILRLHRLLGNRWSLIAGRIPGRTDNEIKNYWNTHLSKKLISQGIDPRNHKPLNPNIPTSSSNPQNAVPKSAQHLIQTDPNLPDPVTTIKLAQSFNSMENQLQNIEDYCFQNPTFNSGIGCWPSSSHDPEQSSAAYCIENGNEKGNGNEDHGFSMLLDSLINDDEYFYMNQEQQQQLQIEQMQLQQQPNATGPFVNVSGEPNINNTVFWEAGALSSMAGLGDEDVALDYS